MTEAEEALKDAAEELYGIASQDMPVGGDEVLEAMKKFESAYAHALAEKQRDHAENEWPGDEAPAVLRRVIAGSLADLIDPKVSQPESDQRLQINPDPLKVVEAKAGGPAPDPVYVFARRWRAEYLKAASIHRAWCPMAPEDGKELADGSRWSVEEIPRSKRDDCVSWAADKGIEAKVDCARCGGWSVA
jgi:hypothetical protein